MFQKEIIIQKTKEIMAYNDLELNLLTYKLASNRNGASKFETHNRLNMCLIK